MVLFVIFLHLMIPVHHLFYYMEKSNLDILLNFSFSVLQNNKKIYTFRTT